jgi:uncharacterized membrane protein
MATLTVWKFDSADGAANAVRTLKRFHTQQLVQLQDAASVSWPEDATRASITPLYSLVGPGTFGGPLWGTLFALVFLTPMLGLAIAAGFGSLVAPVSDVGIDEPLIKQLREKLTRGNSALLLLTTSAVSDAVLEEMKLEPGHADVIETNLTREQEARLRRTFPSEPAAAEPAAAEPPIPPARRAAA